MTTPKAMPDTRVTQTHRRTSFSEDVLKLVSGTASAQLLTILASPVLARLYAPEAFGLLALFTSITSIIGVVACLRYELAIMLPESEEEAANLLGVSLLFTVIISILTVPVVWWGRDLIVGWLNSPEMGSYLWLVTPAVFTSGVFLALSYWNSRAKQFGRLSFARVSQSLVTTSTQIIFGLGGYATGGVMIGANLGGMALATAVLGGKIWRDDGKRFRETIHWQTMKSGLKRYRKFPIYNTWAALLNTTSWQLPTFLLSIFFSSSIVGFYALGFRLLYVPMNMIGMAIGQVFFQRAAVARAEGTLVPLVENTFRRLVAIGMVPMLTLALIGEDLFSFAFGLNWSEAGVYTQVLALWAFFWFVSSPLSILFSVLERQEYSFWIQSIIFVTRLLSLLIGGYMGSIYVALGLFSTTGILVYGFLCFRLLYEAGVQFLYGVKQMAFYFALFLPIGVTLVYLKWISASTWTIIVATFLSSVGYGIYLVQTEGILWER